MSSIELIVAPLFRVVPRIATKLVQWRALMQGKELGPGSVSALTCQALKDVGLYTHELASSIHRLPSVQYAEQRLFQLASISHLRSIQREVSGIGLDPVMDAKALGRGLILGCTHIGSFYHALVQAGRLGWDLMVVTGNKDYSQAMVKRLRDVSSIEIRVVPAATMSALSIARQLRKGGVVATMLDVYVDTTLGVDAPLFGKMAATPAGIFQLAIGAGTPIIPFCVTTDVWGGKHVEVDSVISPTSSVLELATTVNQRIEAMVRRHPSSWSAWDSLPYRWSLAQQYSRPC